MSSNQTTPALVGGMRTCGHFGCGTILSQYNPNAVCALHEQQQRLEADRRAMGYLRTPLRGGHQS